MRKGLVLAEHIDCVLTVSKFVSSPPRYISMHLSCEQVQRGWRIILFHLLKRVREWIEMNINAGGIELMWLMQIEFAYAS